MKVLGRMSGLQWLLLLWVAGALNLPLRASSSNSVRLAVSFDRANGWPLLSIGAGTNLNAVYQLQTSRNLTNWNVLGTFLREIAPYPDLSVATNTRFYRAVQLLQTNNWSNQALNYWPLSKFILSLSQPDRVYFHRGDIFHYQFAAQHLPELPSETAAAFDEAVLYPARGQQAVIGGFYGFAHPGSLGVEFVSGEPFEPTRLVELFKTVVARTFMPGTELYLIPSAVQRASVLANLDYFRSNGVPVRELSEVATNNAVHSEGWTVGVLKYVAAADLDVAVAAGVLTPDTILITDATPRDLPPIAGFISLVPSSPNSHTVLRLQSAGLPFLDLPAAQRANVTNLIGKRVLFATVTTPPTTFSSAPPHYPPSWYNQFRLFEFDSLAASLQEEILRRKTNALVQLRPIEPFGAYSTNTDSLRPIDTRYFGSKAANYGILRRTIPNQSPTAIAFSFDLWLDFMAQRLGGGRSLKEEIDLRLALIAADPALTAVKLKEVRDLIEDQGEFTSEQRAAVTNALAVFDPTRKIRFRSSSNAEDLPSFSAAGLYESHSGCLLDDFVPGPADECECDPLDDKRRSVFRAIRKVYASFYNEQPFRERRHFGIKEEVVGMAILVHHSFPDEIELANGIANVDFVSSNQVRKLSIVSQRGAVSVANPEGLDLPERFEGSSEFGQLFPQFVAMSTIRPPNTPVLEFPAEYDRLRGLFETIGRAYSWNEVPGVNRLNFEFKKTPEGLSIKQVRPVYTGSASVEPIFVPEKVVLHTFQGGETPAGLEDSHALKSIWEFESKGWIPGQTGTNSVLFDSARVIYISAGKIVTNEVRLTSTAYVTGSPESPYYWRALESQIGHVTNQFSAVSSEDWFNLGLQFPSTVPGSSPFVYPSDLIFFLGRPGIPGVAELNTAHPARPRFGTVGRTNSVTTNGVTVATSYFLTVNPVHPLVGLGPTWNLDSWGTTTISGVTSIPIVLRGYFSQTYKPGRHNYGEAFLFEPGLEEGIPAELLQELRAADVERIRLGYKYVALEGSIRSTIEFIGFDGIARPVPPLQ